MYTVPAQTLMCSVPSESKIPESIRRSQLTLLEDQDLRLHARCWLKVGSVLNGNLTVQVLKLDLTVPLRKGSETTSGTAKLTSTVRVRRQSTKAACSMLEGRGECPEGKVGCTGAEADFKSPFECNIPESVTRTVSTPDNQQPKRITLDLSSRSGSNKSISHEEAARLRNLLQVGPNPQCAISHALNSCVAIAMHREAPHASSTERGLHSPISCFR